MLIQYLEHLKNLFLFKTFVYLQERSWCLENWRYIKSCEFLLSFISLMTAISSLQACIFLTTSIFSVSGFKILSGRDDEILFPFRRSDPDLVRADGIMRSLRSEPIFGGQLSMHNNGIMRSIKRSAGSNRNVHSNGLMRSLRSVENRSLMSTPSDENSQDDEQTTYFMDEKDVNFNRGLRSVLPEEIRSIRSTLIPNHPYDGIALRYL